MENPGFDWIRGANDRLHTDAFVNGSFSEVSDLNGQPEPLSHGRACGIWRALYGARMGIARAPLNIAHVVEFDLPTVKY